jgi:putative transposase
MPIRRLDGCEMVIDGDQGRIYIEPSRVVVDALQQLIGDQRWSTFVANHAKAIVACDFLTVVTATFKFLYVFVIIEIETRKLIHTNVTDHPTAAWTLQQLREAIPSDHTYRFLIHDRDCIFSADLDKSIRNLGLRVLKSPYRSPLANCFCERVSWSTESLCPPV